MKVHEKETTAAIDPEINLYDLCLALLGKTEYENFNTTHSRFIVDGKLRVNVNWAVYNALLKHFKPESLAEGGIKVEKSSVFSWTRAKHKICEKYGLSDIKYRISRSHINTIILKSVITSNNPGTEEQKLKFVNVLRVLKQFNQNIMMKPTACNDVTSEINPCDLSGFAGLNKDTNDQSKKEKEKKKDKENVGKQ
jgi:hypothetical protein